MVSLRLVDIEPATRLWVGFTRSEPLSADGLARLHALADEAARLLRQEPSRDQQFQRFHRLELAARLIPALVHVLDVREVIDRLSATAKRALPHDLLLLNLFSEDLSTFTVYARSDQGAGLGLVRPNPYPASTIQAWTFSIVDDHTPHPMERDSPATKIGARSSLRFPVRFDDRVIGGVSFVSFRPQAYSEADVPIGNRLAEHVASAISHFNLAGRLAEQAKRTEELRAQTTNLELLDELLSALTDSGEIADVSERVSAIAGKVMQHDAMALLVQLPDGRHHRAYATRGFPAGAPGVAEVPEALLDNPDWEHDIIDDVSRLDVPQAGLADMGFYSLLRVPIRLDGRSAGALVFVAKPRSAFKPSDILVARRCDRDAAVARGISIRNGRQAAADSSARGGSACPPVGDAARAGAVVAGDCAGWCASRVRAGARRRAPLVSARARPTRGGRDSRY